MEQTLAERSAFREGLLARGYSDDGDRLYGRVDWVNREGAACSTAVVVDLGEGFPFVPPTVCLDEDDEQHDSANYTFHLDPGGSLCLWDADAVVEGAAWRTADGLLDRVTGWFKLTADGWPGDEDVDLERYLRPSGLFVAYDADELATITGPVRVDADRFRTCVTGTPFPTPQPGHRTRRKSRVRLAWVGDLGPIEAPIRGWDDLAGRWPPMGEVEPLIRTGYVSFLMLRYQRRQTEGVLIAQVRVADGRVELRGCEAADVSVGTRTLRSESTAPCWPSTASRSWGAAP